jgi:GNAT superfamily N-acetyltransferase
VLLGKDNDLKILRINPQDALRIRKENLPSDCLEDQTVFKLDHDEQSFHLGAFEENKLVSVASFYFEQNPQVEGEHHYRLIGLTTDPEYRKKGIATNVLKSAFPLVKGNMCQKIWCNAHRDCLDFYQKNGFTPAEDLNNPKGHVLMYKDLN